MTTRIGKAIEEAIKYFVEKDYEYSLLHICRAVDNTAKRKYPDIKQVKTRICKFIKQYESFIYSFGTNGGLQLGAGGRIVLYKGNELPELIYRFARCPLAHCDELEIVKFQESINGFIFSSSIHLPIKFIEAFILITVCDPENKNEISELNPLFIYNRNEYSLNSLWGREDEIQNFLPGIAD